MTDDLIKDLIKDLYGIDSNKQYSFNYDYSTSANNDYSTSANNDYTSNHVITTGNSGWATAQTITTGTIAPGTWTTTIATYPTTLQIGEEAWPIIKDTLGIVFIDGDLIRLRTKNGKEVIIGKLSDDEKIEIIPLEVIAAKKKLLEGSKEEYLV